MRGVFLKGFLVVTAVLFISAGFASSAGATIYTAEDPFIQNMDYVTFWAVDDPGTGGTDESDDQVIFGVVNISNLTIQYSLDNINWPAFTSGTTLSPIYAKTMVYLRLVDGSTYDYSAQLIFSGFDRNYYDVDAYNSLIIKWNDTDYSKLTIATPAGVDDVAPVPIPATAWLLGAGLVAIIGIRRKRAE